MRIDFYYTAKRLNSLVRPDIDEAQTVVTTFTDFHLKDQTDMNHPVFIVVASNLPETNYCILSDTGASAERPNKYRYFVDRIEQYRKTIWHIYCTIDALATWRDSILTQSAFVVRSSNTFEPYEIDTLLPTKNKVARNRLFSYLNEAFTTNEQGGSYMISLCANSINEVAPRTMGGISHIILDYTNASDLVSMFYDLGTAQQLVQTFGNASSAIVGCVWVPLKYSVIGASGTSPVGDAVQNLRVAGLQKFINGTKLSRIYKLIQSNRVNISLTHFGDFRDNAPYRSYFLKLPWYGFHELDSDLMGQINRDSGGSTTMYVNVYYDFLGGVIKYIVYIGNYLVCNVEACAKVDIPISTFKTNIAGMIAGVLNKSGEVGQATMSRAQERANLQLSGGTKGKYTDTVQNFFKPVTSSVSIDKYGGGDFSIVGGYSGTLLGGVDSELVLYEKVQDTVVSPSNISSLMGRPYGGVVALSSLTGYCQTDGFHMRGRMTSEEKQLIEDAFNGSGVFITE